MCPGNTSDSIRVTVSFNLGDLGPGLSREQATSLLSLGIINWHLPVLMGCWGDGGEY